MLFRSKAESREGRGNRGRVVGGIAGSGGSRSVEHSQSIEGVLRMSRRLAVLRYLFLGGEEIWTLLAGVRPVLCGYSARLLP